MKNKEKNKLPDNRRENIGKEKADIIYWWIQGRRGNKGACSVVQPSGTLLQLPSRNVKYILDSCEIPYIRQNSCRQIKHSNLRSINCTDIWENRFVYFVIIVFAVYNIVYHKVVLRWEKKAKIIVDFTIFSAFFAVENLKSSRLSYDCTDRGTDWTPQKLILAANSTRTLSYQNCHTLLLIRQNSSTVRWTVLTQNIIITLGNFDV